MSSTSQDREAIRAMLAKRYHGAIDITDEMISAVIDGLAASETAAVTFTPRQSPVMAPGYSESENVKAINAGDGTGVLWSNALTFDGDGRGWVTGYNPIQAHCACGWDGPRRYTSQTHLAIGDFAGHECTARCRNCGNVIWYGCECGTCDGWRHASGEHQCPSGWTGTERPTYAEPVTSPATTCGESDGTSTCAVRPGEHAPASNCPDGPVHHVSADGYRWVGPVSDGERAEALEVLGYIEASTR